MQEVGFTHQADKFFVADYRDMVDLMLVKYFFERRQFVARGDSKQIGAHNTFDWC